MLRRPRPLCGLQHFMGLALLLGLAAPLRAQQAPRGDMLRGTFEAIWQENRWQSPESRSGPGSTLAQTDHVRGGIEGLIRDYGMRSILDAACGDFGWMASVDVHGASYVGLDIVAPLVAQNNARYAYAGSGRRFVVADITRDALPRADLVIARDVLGHLSYVHGLQALKNVRASGAKWFLSTTFTNRRANMDVEDGGWRPINLSAAPYALGAPTAILVEHCTEGNGRFADKSLGLWPVERLPQ